MDIPDFAKTHKSEGLPLDIGLDYLSPTNVRKSNDSTFELF